MRTVLIVGWLGILGCSAAIDEGGGRAGGGAPAGRGGAAEAPCGGLDAPIEEGLFACDAPSSCPDGVAHSELHWCSRGLPECAAELVARGTSGVLRATDAPGGGNDVTDLVVILRGDGTAWRQSRRHEDADSTDDVDGCWTMGPLELCDVIDATCGIDEGTWSVEDGLARCAPAEGTPTCGDVEAVLETSCTGSFDAPVPEGMFGCFEAACAAHLEEPDGWCDAPNTGGEGGVPSAASCAGAHVAAGRPTLIEIRAEGTREVTDTFVLLDGDGTATVQRRRYVESDGCWITDRDAQRCDVVDATCGGDGTWDVDRGLAGCVPLDAPTCAEMEATLSGP